MAFVFTNGHGKAMRPSALANASAGELRDIVRAVKSGDAADAGDVETVRLGERTYVVRTSVTSPVLMNGKPAATVGED